MYNDGKSKVGRRKKSFSLKNKLNYTAIKDVRNLLKQEKETKAIKDRILSDIKNLFEQEEVNYYKPVTVNNFWSNNYIEYESDSDRNKTSKKLKNMLIKLDHI